MIIKSVAILLVSAVRVFTIGEIDEGRASIPAPRPRQPGRRRWALLRRFESGGVCLPLRRLDRGGFLLDHCHEVIDDIAIL